jgi:hypothetical protein
MTDYHSVIAREIAALGKFARPIDRGALYERARSAFVALLEGGDTPALDESQMIRLSDSGRGTRLEPGPKGTHQTFPE